MRNLWQHIVVVAALGGNAALWPQGGHRPPEDQLYTAYVLAQHDFLTLDPSMERELLSGSAEQSLARIERSRKAAEVYSKAKVAYYRELFQKSEELLNALQAVTKHPAEELLVQLRQRRKSLAENESDTTAEIEKLRAQRNDMVSRNGSASEITRLDDLIRNAVEDQGAIRKAKSAVEQALASADRSQSAARDVMPALERWKAIQQQSQEHYQKLLQSAEQQVKLWDAYHRDLKQIVVDNNEHQKRK